MTCFSVDPVQGLLNQMVLGFDPSFNETVPPNGPPNTASQILFKEDSSALIALTKGNPGTTPPMPGSIIIYPVDNSKVSPKPQVDNVKDILLEFGSVWVSEDKLFISDPSFGAAIVSVTGTTVTEEAHITIEGQVAVCWATYDASSNTAYAIDAGKNVITAVDVASGKISDSIMVSLPQLAQDPGLFDTVVADSKMYSLAAASGIVVSDLAKQGDFQFVDLSHLGSRQGWTGMAMY